MVGSKGCEAKGADCDDERESEVDVMGVLEEEAPDFLPVRESQNDMLDDPRDRDGREEVGRVAPMASSSFRCVDESPMIFLERPPPMMEPLLQR